MARKAVPKNLADLPLTGLLLECTEDRYKLPYAALRWAKEIKQKENLADPVPSLLPRALRDIMSGKVTLKEIEKLPMIARAVAQPMPTIAPTPTITLNPQPDEEEEAEEKPVKKEE